MPVWKIESFKNVIFNYSSKSFCSFKFTLEIEIVNRKFDFYTVKGHLSIEPGMRIEKKLFFRSDTGNRGNTYIDTYNQKISIF